MSVVIDANALVALSVLEPEAPAISAQVEAWDDAGEDLHAPLLARYEIAGAFAKRVSRGESKIERLALA